MTDSGGETHGRCPVLARLAGLVQASLGRLTWATVWRLEVLGALANGLRVLQNLGSSQALSLFVANTILTTLMPLAAILAAYLADEVVQRGHAPWRTYLTALAGCSALLSLIDDVSRHLLGFPFEGPLATARGNEWLWVTDDFMYFVSVLGVGFLAFYNRRSVERIVDGLRAAELKRVRLERELLSSRLATAQAEVDPAALFERLAGIRWLYGNAPADADHALEELIDDLRLRRGPPAQTPATG
jgi:hypothetical protein